MKLVHSLKFKIAVMSFCLVAIVIAIVLWQTLGAMVESAERNVLDNQKIILNVVASIAKPALFTEHYPELQDNLNQITQHQNLLKAHVLDTDNRVVASTDATAIGEILNTFVDPENAYWITYEISDHTRVLGQVDLLFSTLPLHAAIQKVWALGTSISILGIILIALASIFMASLLTNRLNIISHSVNQILDGRLGINTGIQGNDEIGQLGEAFDTMSENLKEKIQAFEESEEKYLNLYNNAPDMFASVDPQTRKIIQCNQTLANKLGYSKEEITGHDLLNMYHPSCHTDVEKAIKLFVTTGDVRDTELQLKHKDGTPLDVSLSVSAVRDENGTILYSNSIWRDITERKQAGKTLKLYRSLVDQTNDAIEIIDPHTGRFLDVNERGCLDLGYTREEYLTLSVIDIDPIADQPTFTRNVEELRKSGTLLWEGTQQRKDGSVYPVEINMKYVQFDRDYIIAVVRDITERKQAGKEIARFSHIFEDSLNEIYLFNVDSLKFVQVNNAAQHNLGYTMEELRELTPIDLKPEFTPESFAELLAPLRRGEKGMIVFETVYTRKDQSVYDVEVHLQLLKHEHEALFVSFILDITERKKQAAALNQAQKMEAVGQLTGGIAHDFNNLLSIIGGNLRFLRQDMGKTSVEIDELFEDATSAVNDGTELTQRLLGFSRNRVLQTKIQNVNDTLEQSVRFLSRTLGIAIELDVNLPDKGLFIKVDPSQLENALLNLCLNARDAMPQRGTITLSVTRYHHGEDEGDDLILPAGDYIKISVADTGTGISSEDLQHVYEPFFTTKEVGKGSGLGLTMVYSFTQQSKGACYINSPPGVGTTVSMVFPEVDDDKTRAVDTKDKKEEQLKGAEVILVVEDEPRVRRVTLRDLKGLGYQTLEAENAAIAKTIIASGERIDLLFSDVLMPGEMDGHMLGIWTQENYPQIKVVLTSGYSKAKKEVREDEAHRFPLIRKPYAIEKLARQIRTTLIEGRT